MPPATSPILYVVERDKHVRALLTTFLGAAEHTLMFFDDGLTALQQVRSRPPDLVILEILLPKLDGFGLCRAIKAEAATREVPLLVLSILSASDRARAAGADEFMLKPIEQGRLRRVVDGLLAAGRPGDPTGAC